MDGFSAKMYSDAMRMVSVAALKESETFNSDAICTTIAKCCQASAKWRRCVLRTAWALSEVYEPAYDSYRLRCEQLAPLVGDIRKTFKFNDAQVTLFFSAGLEAVFSGEEVVTEESIRIVVQTGIRMLMDLHLIRMAFNRGLEITNRVELERIAKVRG